MGGPGSCFLHTGADGFLHRSLHLAAGIGDTTPASKKEIRGESEVFGRGFEDVTESTMVFE